MGHLIEEKLAFAGAEWIDAARGILERLVALHGERGTRFSLSEEFANPPANVSRARAASWHFRIDGKSVTVAQGALADADVTIIADYARAQRSARTPYTPESFAHLAEPNVSGISGNMSKAPGYLVELHNALAEITA